MLKIIAKEVLSVGFKSDFTPWAEPYSLNPSNDIASDMPTLPIKNMVSVLLTNIDDPTMSDADFREFVRRILSNY